MNLSTTARFARRFGIQCPMVILLMAKIEFLTEKNCFKVKNHRFSMEKWFCRARKIEKFCRETSCNLNPLQLERTSISLQKSLMRTSSTLSKRIE
jgi:hypothetical protein